MDSAPVDGGRGCHRIIPHDVLDDFIEDFVLDRFLHKMTGALLQCGDNVFLVAHRGNHDNARLRVCPHDALGGLDAFHLGHGDVHQHHVRRGPVIFGDSGAATAALTGDFSAERLHHLGDVLTGEHRVIHHQITDWRVVFTKQNWKLVHKNSYPYNSN